MNGGVFAVEAMRRAAVSRTQATVRAGGRVLSAHSSAINIELEDGSVVAILPSTTPLHPWAISVPDFEAIRSAATEITRVEWDEESLRVGSLLIAPQQLQVMDLALPERLHAHPACEILAVLRKALDAASAEKSEGKNSDETPFAKSLDDVLDRFRRENDFASLAGLVGLGTGFTPAGDDLLVGVLAGLDVARDCDPGASAHRDALIAALPSPLHHHTPRLSAQMLLAAAEGHYPQPIIQLADKLIAHSPTAAIVAADSVDTSPRNSLRAAAAAVAGLGHNSGLHLLRGFLIALSAQRR
jgi:hypothetical protein